MSNQIQTQQVIGVISAAAAVAVMAISFRVIDKWMPEPQAGRMGNPGYAFVKRTKRGSLSIITKGEEKATLEITNQEDMQDITQLLTRLGVTFEMTPGISKSAWEGAPVDMRGPRPVRIEPGNKKAYPGWTVEFDFKELEKVMRSITELGVAKLPSPSHKSARVVVTSEPTPRPEGGTRFYIDVYDEHGTYVLESIYDELPDVIVLTSRYAKPGYAMKGYGTAAFIDKSGPLALSLRTGKPMVIVELSHEGAAFYNALEAKGIARFRQTPNAEYPYVVEPLEKAKEAVARE